MFTAATNDQDVNDIFGKGGSHAAPNTVQTGGGHGQTSGQSGGHSSAHRGGQAGGPSSAQSGGQSGGQSNAQTDGQAGGQRASKPASGSVSSGSTGTHFGQGASSCHCCVVDRTSCS